MNDVVPRPRSVEFLWLELTNACNLQCVHCYSESGPTTGGDDRLVGADYMRLMEKAHARGCRQVQFIGGEAMLSRDLPDLIEHASALGYELIEVFTNLVSFPARYVDLFRLNGVRVATSVYSDTAERHDEVTRQAGSWRKTTANLRKLIAAGIPCRAGVIQMADDPEHLARITAFLQALGVTDIGADTVRPYGRADDAAAEKTMDGLCGTCGGNVLCVGADRGMAPCSMSKAWTVGNVLEDGFEPLLDSVQLGDVRAAIATATAGGRERVGADGGPITSCNPDCMPCTPASSCGPTCSPQNSCYPQQSPYCTPRY